jgi:hypothetical protein
MTYSEIYDEIIKRIKKEREAELKRIERERKKKEQIEIRIGGKAV